MPIKSIRRQGEGFAQCEHLQGVFQMQISEEWGLFFLVQSTITMFTNFHSVL